MPLFNEVVIDLEFVDLNQRIMFDVTMGCVILNVCKVLPCSVLLFEVQDCQTWKDHLYNYASYHFPNVDGQNKPSLVVVLTCFFLMLCEQFRKVAIMLICNQCSRCWHMGYFMLPLEEMLIKKCFCP
jgi:hypothetical protein